MAQPDEISVENDEMKALSERIKQVRKRAGDSQKVFSKKLGLSQSYFSDVENNKANVNIKLITGILQQFPEVQCQWLLLGKSKISERDIEPFDLSLVSTIASNLERYWMAQEFVISGTLDPFRNCSEQQKEVISALEPMIKRFRVIHARSVAASIAVIYEHVVGIKDTEEQQNKILDEVETHVRIKLAQFYMKSGDDDLILEIGRRSNDEDDPA